MGVKEGKGWGNIAIILSSQKNKNVEMKTKPPSLYFISIHS